MTVAENNNPKVQYEDTFILDQQLPIPFPYTEKEHIHCIVNGEEIEYNVDYTILGQTLTLKNEYGKANITIYRMTPLDQQAEFPQNNKFNSQKINEALDKICMQQQEQSEALSRCITADISLKKFNGDLPTPAPKQVLMWNEDVTALENYDIIGENEAFQESMRKEFADTVENIEEELDDFKQETNQNISSFRTETNDKIETFEGTVNTQITEIRNVANDATAVANEALQVANSSVDTANIALGIANNAVATANSSDIKADNAVSTANSASENAYQAVNTANEANTTAGNAQDIANSANNTAIAASNTANAASTKVDEFGEDIEVVIEAAERIQELEGAVEEAKEAATQATNAADSAVQAAEAAISALDSKQDKITDLDVIRSNAQTGADIVPQVESNTQKIEELQTTKANVSLNNLDEQGEKRFTDKQNKLIEGNNITIENDVISAKASGGLEVGDIGLSIFVDETKGLRRYLNGSIVAINDNTQAFLDRLKQVAMLYPSIACTEEEWQTIKTTSAFGQCGKFVIDEANGTIRLPRIVMPIQGLTDLTKLGEIVQQGLPNITGQFNSWRGENQIDIGGIAGQVSGAFGRISGTQPYAIYDDATSSNGTGGVTFNASRSSSIYKDGSNVQQEQVQYPYFIQIATGQETQVDIVNEIELNNPYSLFDCKFVDHLLNNASWLRADTFEWHSGDVYVDAYNLLVEEYNNGTEETYGDGLVFKRSPNGFKICNANQEQKVLNRYDNNSTHWFYILDTDNKRFKLPRTKWGFKGLRGQVGDLVIESLPKPSHTHTRGDMNITGGFNAKSNSYYFDGAFYSSADFSEGQTYWSGVTNDPHHTYRFDASRSWTGSTSQPNGLPSAYQDGAPVQERATQMYLYFYVGETVQNANLIDAGRISEQLTNKVDVDSSWGFPSSRSINLTIGATETQYTAPANGWFTISGRPTVNGGYVILDDNPVTWMHSGTAGWYARGFIPVKKGHTIVLRYGNYEIEPYFFKFVYAEGAN